MVLIRAADLVLPAIAEIVLVDETRTAIFSHTLLWDNLWEFAPLDSNQHHKSQGLAACLLAEGRSQVGL